MDRLVQKKKDAFKENLKVRKQMLEKDLALVEKAMKDVDDARNEFEVVGIHTVLNEEVILVPHPQKVAQQEG
jgi:hypothetical protein